MKGPPLWRVFSCLIDSRRESNPNGHEREAKGSSGALSSEWSEPTVWGGDGRRMRSRRVTPEALALRLTSCRRRQSRGRSHARAAREGERPARWRSGLRPTATTFFRRAPRCEAGVVCGLWPPLLPMTNVRRESNPKECSRRICIALSNTY